MSRSLIERRLTEVSQRLKRARQDLAVLEEQAAAMAEQAEEARIRALVSETPVATKEYQQARRHADTMERSRTTLLATIAELRKSQDELLDRLVIESR